MLCYVYLSIFFNSTWYPGIHHLAPKQQIGLTDYSFLSFNLIYSLLVYYVKTRFCFTFDIDVREFIGEHGEAHAYTRRYWHIGRNTFPPQSVFLSQYLFLFIYLFLSYAAVLPCGYFIPLFLFRLGFGPRRLRGGGWLRRPTIMTTGRNER
ncbi:hypothetical protein F5Y11DRAFT_296549 [Daldinia sp. FL1419]|nr:hypothetical protein F5Y11DRAFT_296549 [Daldinia sp. FL1419]